jgi:hypothetical protein
VGRHSWSETLPEAGWTVRIAADKTDSLSTLVWEMTLIRSTEPPANLTLNAWANAIAHRTSGLLEPLTLHEVDETRQEALLRSQAPAVRGEALSYYEVRLTGLTTAVVRRYTASKTDSGRSQVAYALTHEVLAKLAGDIAG